MFLTNLIPPIHQHKTHSYMSQPASRHKVSNRGAERSATTRAAESKQAGKQRRKDLLGIGAGSGATRIAKSWTTWFRDYCVWGTSSNWKCFGRSLSSSINTSSSQYMAYIASFRVLTDTHFHTDNRENSCTVIKEQTTKCYWITTKTSKKEKKKPWWKISHVWEREREMVQVTSRRNNIINRIIVDVF